MDKEALSISIEAILLEEQDRLSDACGLTVIMDVDKIVDNIIQTVMG
jgi:hypothetical protein